MWAATRLGLLTIDYFMIRCLSRRGWDQHTAYHQSLPYEPMEPTNCVPFSMKIKHVQSFCILWGALLWPIKNNPVCGRTARQQKPELQPKIAALGKTHYLERSQCMMAWGWCPSPSKRATEKARVLRSEFILKFKRYTVR